MHRRPINLARPIERLETRRLFSVGGNYVPPADPRLLADQNTGWKFQFGASGGPQNVGYDDSSWAAVTLPHTWNSPDSTSSPATGNGWYRKSITIGASTIGKELFLNFEGAAQATSLYIGGTQIDFKPSTPGTGDSHNGGFAGFSFDVTNALTLGNHLLAVRVNNSNNNAYAPASGGDYSRQGGLYRDVALVAVNKAHLALNESVTHGGIAGADATSLIASQGVYFSHTPVAIGAASTTVTVKAVLDNHLGSAQPAIVTGYLVDAAGVIRAEASSSPTAIPGSQSGTTVALNSTLSKPHLWDGRIDPYRYDLYVEVRDASNGALLDLNHQRVGIRSFTINANPNTSDADPSNDAAFMLNGHPYTLVGADVHQDSGRPNASGNPTGWAQSDAQIRADADLVAEMGGTVIRTSHYQANQALYDYCDEIGVIVYTENSINGSTQAGDPFLMNAEDQYQELIRQNFHHPSIFAWGFGNETSDSATVRTIFSQLNAISHTLDPSRKTAFSTYGGSTSNAANADGIADIKGTHPYDYWYGGDVSTVISTHNAYPSQPLGVGEFGGGGSAYQYADTFVLPAAGNYGTNSPSRFHPANQLTRIAQTHTTELNALSFLYDKIIWQMFDMPSSGRSEGDQSGVNDKGQVTRDRVRKDSFYYYKAAWNDPARSYANAKVLKLSDQFWTTRNSATTQVTVFSNLGAPTLVLNGASLGVMPPLSVAGNTGAMTVAGCYAMNLTLAAGVNQLGASVVYAGDGQTYSDQQAVKHYNATTFATGAPTNTSVNVNRVFTYNPYTKVTSNPFDLAVPNGVYDVRINATAGTSSAQRINNLSLEGQTADIDTNGGATADTFYARVVVIDGSLTLAAAPGSFNANVTTIDVRAADIIAPTVASSFEFETGHSVRLQFSEDIAASLAEPDFTLVNMTTGATIATAALHVSYTASTNVAVLTAPGLSGGILPNGSYRLTLRSGSIADAAGNRLTNDSTLDFFVLAGDFDRDGIVGFSDLVTLAQNYSMPSGAIFSQGDANYDGAVNFGDLVILAQNYGTVTSSRAIAPSSGMSLTPSDPASSRRDSAHRRLGSGVAKDVLA